MNPSTLGAFGVLALFVMLFLRVPVWIALTLVGFIGNTILSGLQPTFALAGTVPFDVGSALEFPNVLAVFKDGEALTESQLANAKVVATITANDRAKKIVVFKFKRKKQYKRTIGHRQHFTELRVNEIVA